MDRYLNIIALNIPYPPNYGGVIDIYYKIKALHALGVKILLHCFEYERLPAPELEDICEAVFYYTRRTGLVPNVSYLPYNVLGRKSPQLIENILTNDYPILFEGLHSCYYLPDNRLNNRHKILRTANIEHHYYKALAKTMPLSVKKAFLLTEATRFKLFQSVIKYADVTVAISMTDADYLKRQFRGKHIEFMPAYHSNDQIGIQTGQSDFILYHAKLSVAENEHAALYLIKNVFSRLDCHCVIAGMDPSRRLLDAAAPYQHISIEANPSAGRMDYLIREAQIHLLATFQDTGLKLKLLNSLFAGRHIVVNSMMLAGSGLDPLCHIADTPDEMVTICNRLMKEPVTPSIIGERKKFLIPAYSNEYQAKRLYGMIYEKT